MQKSRKTCEKVHRDFLLTTSKLAATINSQKTFSPNEEQQDSLLPAAALESRMRLRYTVNSPFARKARVVAHELGMADSIELVSTALRTQDRAFWADNPIAKVPVLVTNEGFSLSDSNVIMEYLNVVHGQGRLLAASGPQRWKDLTLISTADAVVEAAILARSETARPPEQQNKLRIEQEMAKVARGLDAIDKALEDDMPGQPVFGLAGIAVSSALGWLELRFGPELLFNTRPGLGAWWAQAMARPSMQATQPSPDA